MEIQTTIKDFSDRMKHLGISPETSIRVIIDKADAKDGNGEVHDRKEAYLPFLDSGMWDGEDVPEDLSSNVDQYLYDLDEPHGE